MKFIHLADLHLGRRLGGYSLIEDQEVILDDILGIIDEEKPDFVIAAGDVYDKLSPSGEAVALLDRFLTELSGRSLPVFIIAGNHDSPERIAFGARIMNRSGIYFSPVYDGRAEKITLTDEYGDVNIYLLPFLRAAEVRRFFPDRDIPDTAAAVRTAVGAMEVDLNCRNIIVSHQFVTGGITSDSERGAVGGTDGVPAEQYSFFDYAALGHLHFAQSVGGEHIRYGGTPLKYSVSEANQHKSVTVCELGEKGTPVRVTQRELHPLRDLRVLKGSYDELIAGGSDDFVQIILADLERIPDAQKRLHAVYPHLLGVSYEYEAKREDLVIEEGGEARTASPAELFEEFYANANGMEMTEEQRVYMTGLINSIWG